MKSKIGQLIFFPENGLYITLVAIKWKNANSGELTMYGQPAKLKRVENFNIENKEVVTDSFHFPLWYLIKWLKESGAIDENNVLTNIEL